ncbi:MAG: FmdB family transcriptional regulator, partial [Desulfobacca sp.]|nr:FmdB family transcriptional regulator [Desulfobacca sp.]
MPIYEYECQHCSQVTEAMQKFSDPPLTECPQCQGNLRKMISQSSFHLKGSGWYVTDYARKGDSTAPAKQEKPAEGSNKTSETSSDSSPSSALPAAAATS